MNLTLEQFRAHLREAAERFSKRLPAVKELVDSDRVYLFGYGGKGKMLAQQISCLSSVNVIVFDANPAVRAMAVQDGFRVVTHIDQINQASYGTILGACQAQLEQAALLRRNQIYYQEAAYIFDAPHLASKARDFSDSVLEKIDSLYRIYLQVNNRSRNVFLAVLSFRLSLDPHDLADCRQPNSEMWFDIPAAESNRGYRTYLDVGAFDGDTLQQARARLSVSRGIAVEANEALFGSINEVGKSYPDGIQIMPCAAWSHSCQLEFREVRGGMISVAEAANGDLHAGPIDDFVNEPVDMMKMDVEGAELSALTGCAVTLKSSPDLAIAGYHRPDDLLSLPEFLANLGYTSPEFDLHIGHYSDCFDDTILYYLRQF